MTRTRKQYSPEFKREAVRLAKDSGNLSRTARDLGVTPEQIRKWRQAIEAHGGTAFPSHGNPQEAELARLQRELAKVREENTILKKAVGIFSSPPL